MIGSTVSHYKILEKLGEGGMGVVYKAEDTKLDRLVALKFLPERLNASAQDKARFIQEAKAASALNHPNVCTIHDIQEADDPVHGGKQMFIVMEYVDGQTLRDKKGSISFKQAIDIGIQVADGLAAAHEKGIVHRDIKPDNIMIRKDGIAQIMDFGLAKLRASGSKISRLTKEGSTIGTAGYMSPEQVQGHDTDHRSDIFSYGVLLYELLTGQLPFKGVHETALAYEIVNVDAAPMSSVNSEIDPSLDAIVLECLEKDPNERMQSIKQVAVELKRYKRESSRQRVSRVTAARPAIRVQSPASVPEQVPRSSQAKLPWVIACILLAALAVVSWLYVRAPKDAGHSLTANLLPPTGWTYRNDYDGGHIALSPDGSILAFVAKDSMGKPMLWVQSIKTGVAQFLPETEDASFPFWSPDNRSIGFFAGGNMKQMLASGGPPSVICPAPSGRGGSWNAQGTILFSPQFDVTGLFRVNASGGDPVQVTHNDKGTNHRWPRFLPDGNHFIYTSQASSNTNGETRGLIYLSALDSSLNKTLLKISSNVAYADGHLLYVRSGIIVAQKFDERDLAFIGDPVPVSSNVEFSLDKSRGVFDVSRTGIFIYQPGQITNLQFDMVWCDRNGRRQPLEGNPRTTYSARISPDGKKIAYETIDASSKRNDIWVRDLTRGLSTRFTFENSEEAYPVWSPDGGQLVFISDLNSQSVFYLKNLNGKGSEVRLGTSDENIVLPRDWSRNGTYLLYYRTSVKGSSIDYLTMDSSHTVKSFITEAFNVENPRFSPDGRWVAYESGETGERTEIFVRSFPSGDSKWQISTKGGRFPQWRPDGKEFYYLSFDGTVMAVDVDGEGQAFGIGKSAALFTIPRSSNPALYDVAADGQRFLMGILPGSGAPQTLKLVTNWDEGLK